MKKIYEDGTYLEKTGSWHVEDSDWKAEHIGKILGNIHQPITSAAEIGCGAGRILEALSKQDYMKSAKLYGFDISPQAIELCKQVKNSSIEYACHDPLDPSDTNHFDLLLAIDVFEHVPDYFGFLERCQKKATYKIYHIPLDVHVSSVLRDRLYSLRQELGHLHYFTAKTAIATLEDTGHRIIASQYTNGAIGLFWKHPSFKRAIANLPRWMISCVSTSLSAKLLGGYSLLVLAE